MTEMSFIVSDVALQRYDMYVTRMGYNVYALKINSMQILHDAKHFLTGHQVYTEHKNWGLIIKPDTHSLEETLAQLRADALRAKIEKNHE